MTPHARLARDHPETHRDKVKRALASKKRLDAVVRSGLIEHAHAMPALNRTARLAARSLHAPIAQVQVLTNSVLVPIASFTERTEDAEVWRAKRRVGPSFSKYVIWSKEPFGIGDARKERLLRNSKATRDLGIVAYLGAPIRAPRHQGEPGAVIGAVCVIDRTPREWLPGDVELLSDVAEVISDEIEYRQRTRKEVGTAVRQAERILEAAGAAVLTTDANGVTTYANPAALRLLGYSADEMLGHDQHALIHHSRPDGSRYHEVDCPNYRARREGQTYRVNHDTFWRSDGAPVSVQSTMTPIFDRGEVIGTVLTFADVSERQAAEEAERYARLAAEAANRAKTELVAAMTQELLAPLSSMADHAQRLQHLLVDAATPAQREELAGIVRSQRYLTGLLDNRRGIETIGSGDRE